MNASATWAKLWISACAGLWSAGALMAAESDKTALASPRQEKAAKPEPAMADPAKEPSLAEQIREALDGKGNAMINLGKRAPKKERAQAPSMAGGSTRESTGAPTSAGHAAMARRSSHGAAYKPQRAPAHWSYEGEGGPQSWSKLDPAYGLCLRGQRQSPIHIESAQALSGPSDDLEFSYKTSQAEVVNNGHTFQVDLGAGSELVARAESYRLIQFHFHHPSEEKIDYKGFPMVVHLVHKSESGRWAVVAIELNVGAPNPAIAKAWSSLPLDIGDKAGVSQGINPADLLPALGLRKYFQYMGSLTTPPCSEGVLWLVLKTPMTVSIEQLALFERFFPMNARPIQEANGRLIREQE
jgi:carbonic anhydrase